MIHCEVVEVRNSGDVVGLACLRTAWQAVFGLRGCVVRIPRGDVRYVPRHVLPALFVVPPGAAPESRLSGSRTTSGAKERLKQEIRSNSPSRKRHRPYSG